MSLIAIFQRIFKLSSNIMFKDINCEYKANAIVSANTLTRHVYTQLINNMPKPLQNNNLYDYISIFNNMSADNLDATRNTVNEYITQLSYDNNYVSDYWFSYISTENQLSKLPTIDGRHCSNKNDGNDVEGHIRTPFCFNAVQQILQTYCT